MLRCGRLTVRRGFAPLGFVDAHTTVCFTQQSAAHRHQRGEAARATVRVKAASCNASLSLLRAVVWSSVATHEAATRESAFLRYTITGEVIEDTFTFSERGLRTGGPEISGSSLILGFEI